MHHMMLETFIREVHCDLMKIAITVRKYAQQQDPDAANEQSNTPLHWACLNGQEKVGTAFNSWCVSLPKFVRYVAVHYSLFVEVLKVLS